METDLKRCSLEGSAAYTRGEGLISNPYNVSRYALPVERLQELAWAHGWHAGESEASMHKARPAAPPPVSNVEGLYRAWLDAAGHYGDVLRQAEELIQRDEPVPADLLRAMDQLETDVLAKLEAFALSAQRRDRPHEEEPP